ncbi:MAG TPA: helicase-exonuclease AddAB subunit AddA [Clostridia bacterium]|nr:helicase-exonuclease AddAB subunit AddA [Clostridia bacterium]
MANKTGKWTEEQSRAISEEGCNLLVAAAAGAGKTAVLVERIIRKITRPDKPVDIDRLLVVTFTNAAAAEMRERIGSALGKVLDEASREEKEDTRKLQRQLALLGRASITTIHSFCLDVIRNNFHTLDLDPSFRIADDTEALLLRLEALEELVESKYEPENCTEAFLSLVECYGGSKDDKKLMDLVLTVYEFVQSYPWPEVWLREAVEAFNPSEGIDFAETKWAGILMKNISLELTGLLPELEAAMKTAEKAEGLYPYKTVLQEDSMKVKAILEACGSAAGWDALYREFGSLEFSRLPRCGKDADPAVQEEVKGIRDTVKGKLNKLKKELVSGNSEELSADMRQMYPLMESLAGLVLEFSDKYREKKKQKGVIDFNDLEHYCLKVLTCRTDDGGLAPTQAALDLRERYEEIYVDEYQDSNLTQEVILGMTSREARGEPNIFMVGDVKQSIYRFRQAKPELFIKKLKTYSGDSSSKYRKILLNKNFRSREEILKGVNYIFGHIMSEGLGDIDYTEEEALNAGAVFPVSEASGDSIGGPVELHIIDSKEAEAAGAGDMAEDSEEQGGAEGMADIGAGDRPDAIQCEARLVVKRIKELVNDVGTGFLVADRNTGKYRPARYSDIVILMRTTRNWADVFAEELSLYGIPVYTDTGSGYFRTIEISTMLSLLQIIDNPLQDIPLLSVLRSPIAGFSTEELIDIRFCDREATFFEAMKKAAEAEGEAGSKAAGFIESLGRWREKSLYLSTDELIWYLYNDTGYFSFVGAMPGGAKRQANLRLLSDKARQYEESSFKGLFNFISFINKLKGSQGDMGSARTLGEKDNVVRLMSIHKSKGLEFPIVFVCGTGKGFNLTDTAKDILLHHELGIGPDFIDHNRRLWYPSIFKQALKYKIRLESLSEEMRILYVAFTRAREKLIITGTVKEPCGNPSRWISVAGASEKVPEFDILKGKSFMDWICSALMRHPSGQLAERLGIDPPEISGGGDDSRWDIRLWSRDEVLGAADAEAAGDEKLVGEVALTSLEAEADAYGDIIKRLEWIYPYSAYEKLPVKVTVTELKRYFDTETVQEYPAKSAAGIRQRPRFLEEAAELTAAEKGSLMHFVLQHMDFSEAVTEAGIRRQVEAMTAAELLTEVQARNVNIRKISGFMKSELGKRMINAGKLYREVPFTMEVDCCEVFGGLGGCDRAGETVVLQGIIDCYFEEAGKLVLVDYKTDYVPEDEQEQLKEKYRTQIDYYTRALKQITGRELAGRYIYLFWNGEVLEY